MRIVAFVLIALVCSQRTHTPKKGEHSSDARCPFGKVAPRGGSQKKVQILSKDRKYATRSRRVFNIPHSDHDT